MAGTNISTVDMWNYVRAAAAVTPQEIARERKAQEISSDPQPEASPPLPPPDHHPDDEVEDEIGHDAEEWEVVKWHTHIYISKQGCRFRCVSIHV